MLRRLFMAICSLLCFYIIVGAGETSLQPRIAGLRSALERATVANADLAEDAAQALHNAKLRQHGLVDLRQAIPDAIIDMKYAGADNFTGQAIYPTDQCLLSASTGNKLVNAAAQLRERGYRLKIFDAYRPAGCQQALYDAAPDKKYVANPNGKGSNHSRAAAIDMTICDMQGNELAMPSGFDDLSFRAGRDQELSGEVEAALRMVEDIMTNSGFKPLRHEWWHYDDTDAAQMPLLDIPLEYF